MDGLMVAEVQEITTSTIPDDYVNKRKTIHRCWRITL
jgi:23S rRNA (cytosine1962-C5)-methyltransferase